MLSNISKFWAWLIVSSADPTQVATTVKGWMTMLVPALMFVLHNPNLSTLPEMVYSVVLGIFAVVSAIITIYGLIMKIIRTFEGKNLALQAFASMKASQASVGTSSTGSASSTGVR